MGDGVYFWQDAPARALEWAQKQHGSKAAVLCAVIRLEDCLDLLDPSWSNFLGTAYDLFVTKCKLAQIRIPKQDPTSGARRLDREVINYACGISEVALGIQFRVVRGAFQEGRPVYPTSGLYTHSHIQIAVRDLSVIEECYKLEEEL